MSEIKIRPSMASSYPDCPLRAITRAYPELFEAAGFHLNRTGTSIAAAVGTGVHAGAATTLTSIITDGVLSPEDEATDAAIEAMRGGLSEAEEVITDDITPNVMTAEKQVLRMLRVYRSQVAPTLTPMKVELRLEADLSDGFYLSGQADLVTIGPNGIDDTKTGAADRVHMAQLGSYSLIFRSHGYEVTQLRQTFIPRTSIKKPQAEAVISSYPVDVAEIVAEATIERIKTDVTTMVETGDPFRIQANPNSSLCSAKWCSAYGTRICRRHKGAT